MAAATLTVGKALGLQPETSWEQRGRMFWIGSAVIAAHQCLGKGPPGQCMPKGDGCSVLRQVASVFRKTPSYGRRETSSLSMVNCLLERAIPSEGSKVLCFCRACYIEEGQEEQIHFLLLASRHVPAHAHPMDTHQTKLSINLRSFCLQNTSSHVVSQQQVKT